MKTLLAKHRSIRKFRSEPIAPEVLQNMLEAASRASTCGNMQLYSLIVTQSRELREALAPCHFNQPMVTQAPCVITVCADVHRFSMWCEQRDAEPCYDNFAWFLNGVTDALLAAQNLCVEAEAHGLGICYLGTTIYTAEEIARIENFAEEIANEKMTGQLYTTGVPYSPEKIRSSVMAMSADPIAYSVAALDRQRGKVTDTQLKSQAFFTQHYLEPAKQLVRQVLGGQKADDALVCRVAGITPEKLAEAHTILTPPRRGMMMGRAATPTEYTADQKREAQAIAEVERTVTNIQNYKRALEESPEMEMRSILNALAGGYVAPTSGGDAVANPQAVPTGRNLYAVNAETTPSEQAWAKGKELAENTLAQYKKTHGDYPRKVSYTFWSSEFIESEGATIAQVLYMLGVEPVRDAYGRVSDLRLIPSEQLGRPRVDVIVQTSGQFRDLAASRLALISRAVEMAAAATDDRYGNRVAESTVETERLLVEQGVSPKDAREMSTQRVFGGVNGMYGTGIQDMITSGDKWTDEQEIADAYINNMGAVYGSDEEWGEMKAAGRAPQHGRRRTAPSEQHLGRVEPRSRL